MESLLNISDDLPDRAPEDVATSPDESVAQLRARGRGLQLLPNPHVTGLASAVLLTTGEIDTITAMSGSVPEDLAAMLDARVRAGVEQCNAAFYRYDLRYVDTVSEATRLDFADGDVLRSRLIEDSTIKLVVVLPLMNRSGTMGTAEVCVPTFDKRRPLQLGEAVLFPAFAEPRFDLPSSTAVASLVFLAYGPAFR